MTRSFGDKPSAYPTQLPLPSRPTSFDARRVVRIHFDASDRVPAAHDRIVQRNAVMDGTEVLRRQKRTERRQQTRSLRSLPRRKHRTKTLTPAFRSVKKIPGARQRWRAPTSVARGGRDMRARHE